MVSTRGSANAAAQAARSESSSQSEASSRGVAPVAAVAPATVQAVDVTTLLAQLAAVGPALTALATSLGVQQDQRERESEASVPEPEEEPTRAGRDRDHSEDAEDADVALLAGKDKTNQKIDLRNIKIGQFDGTVPAGGFDSKAREHCEELEDQMEDAQVLSNQPWSDDVKKAVFKMHLMGMARRWYADWRAANPAATYADSVSALIHEFRPVQLGVDVAERIKKERKCWNETYREYADRLLQMADALEGGKAIAANARHALVAFVRNAYPKYTDFLETKVELEDEYPEAQLKIAISALARKAETDGRLPDRRKPAATATPLPATKTKHVKLQHAKKPGKPNAKDNKKRPAEANAAVVERKKKPKITHDNPNKGQIVCYECGATGHVGSFCRTFLNGNKDGKFGKGSAQLAKGDGETAEDANENANEKRASGGAQS